MLVEGNGAIVVAHIDFEFARRTSALPAVVGIAQAEIFLGNSNRPPMSMTSEEGDVPDITYSKPEKKDDISKSEMMEQNVSALDDCYEEYH